MMRDWLKISVCVSIISLSFCRLYGDNLTSLSDPNAGEVRAAVIICKGMIDDGLYKSIKRRSELAIEKGADYLVYEVQTYGGLVQSADDISKYLILDVGKRIKTIAYVTSEAISAGAMVSVSCQDIVMLENTTIGDSAPITMGGRLEGVEREKMESFVRAIFERAAEANGYPAALLKAMVTMQIEVYRIQNIESGEYEYFEGDRLPTDANEYAIGDKELIVGDDKLLTVTSSKALEYGIARAEVSGMDEMFSFIEGRDNVKFVGEPIMLKTNWSEEMVRKLNSPAVLSILVTVALLGVYIELNTPGIGLPGLVAAICFAIIIGSKYLVGLANWVEVALFVLGVILLLVEIFVIPGFGITGAVGIVLIIVGLLGMLIRNRPDEIPWPETEFDVQIFLNGLYGLAFGFIGFAFFAWLLSRYLPKWKFMSGLILAPSVASAERDMRINVTAPPETAERLVDIGERGEVVNAMRPAGRAKFGDRIVDVVGRGEFLETGTKVEIIEIHGNRVVVRAVDEREKDGEIS